MLLKGLLLVIDDVAVLNFCRQSEERIMAEVRFCAHVLVVSWTYYLNIVLAHGFVHHTDFLVCQSACIAIDDVAECPCRYRFNASVHIACSLNGLLD